MQIGWFFALLINVKEWHTNGILQQYQLVAHVIVY